MTEPVKQIEIDSHQLELASLEDRLKLSYEERIDAHQNALDLLNDLTQAGKDTRAKSQRPT